MPAHFSFLPPLAQATINGVFNPYLKPAVEICHLNASSVCDALLQRFETKRFAYEFLRRRGFVAVRIRRSCTASTSWS